MNVLSLFDGMGCGQIALKELGIKVDNYYASEIDKFAIQQTQHNFPDTIQLGDVTDIKANDLPKIDLLIGGSPCQGFSFAGKQLNFDDPRSALFFEFVRLKNELKPKHFLLENVNMKRQYLRVISEYLGLFPVNINSSLVSAQNRNRWYWTNIQTKDVGLFSELWTDIPQPKDRGIFLKDILQDESTVDSKYYLSIKAIKSIVLNPDNLQKSNVNPDKSNPLLHPGHSGGIYKGMTCVAMRGRNPDNPSDRTTGSPTEQRLEAKTDGKTNCLTSVAKDNLVFYAGIENGEIKEGLSREFSQGARIYKPEGKGVCLSGEGGGLGGKTGLYLIQKSHGFNKGGNFEDKSPTVLSNSWEHNNHITDGYRLRRLTPLECARLQTIPEWYKWIVSDSQAYKVLGNGWTVDIIKHIFNYGLKTR